MNVIVDYFQPINTSHLQVAHKLYEKNGRKSVFIAVCPANRPARYPIPGQLIKETLDDVKRSFDVIIDTFVVDTWNVDSLLDVLRGKYFPSVIACTTKRVKDYSMQLDFHLKLKPQSPLRKTLLVEVDHNDFGDDLQISLIEKNEELFKQKTPPVLHKRFEQMAQYYTKDLEITFKENQNRLKDHFNFLKMVIHNDSTVDLKSSLVTALDSAKRKIEMMEEDKFLTQRCVERGFTEEEALEFLDRVVYRFDSDTVAGFVELLRDKTRESWTKPRILKLNDRFMGYGIDPEFITAAIEFKPTNRDNFGGGEFLTALLFNCARKAPVGDVMVGNKKIEVKNNDSQLSSNKSLKGASPYLDLSIAASGAAYDLFDSIIESGLKKVTGTLKKRILETAKSGEFNLNQTGIRNYLNIISEGIKVYGVDNEDIFVNWFCSIIRGPGGVMEHWNTLKLKDELPKMTKLAELKVLSAKDLLGYICWMAFVYYSKIDEFDGILIYRSKSTRTTAGYAGYIPSDTDFTQFEELIEPVTGPSITDPRTSKAFKIRLRDVNW